MIIRRATESDIDALIAFNHGIAIEKEGVALSGEVLRQGLHGLLSQERYGFYSVAEIDGQVVGSLMITYEWSDWRNGVIWWIQSVYVRAENRRQGVYTALYENARKSARESGDVAAIRLYVEKDNDVAQQTYSKLGMKETYYRIFETASV